MLIHTSDRLSSFFRHLLQFSTKVNYHKIYEKNRIFKRGLKSNGAIGLTVVHNALQLYTRVYLGSIHHSTPSH